MSFFLDPSHNTGNSFERRVTQRCYIFMFSNINNSTVITSESILHLQSTNFCLGFQPSDRKFIYKISWNYLSEFQSIHFNTLLKIMLLSHAFKPNLALERQLPT